MEKGVLKGDNCNRNGCKGIINEHEKEGCCSCHINPPCGYCTTDTSYCPVCNWSAEEELNETESKRKLTKTIRYDDIMEVLEARRQDILDKMEHKKPIDKIEWLSESHTHFSMIKKGVYPNGATEDDVIKEVNGTFGGRFTKFDKNAFEFIAYTD